MQTSLEDGLSELGSRERPLCLIIFLYWNRIPKTHNLKEEMFVLAHSFGPKLAHSRAEKNVKGLEEESFPQHGGWKAGRDDRCCGGRCNHLPP